MGKAGGAFAGNFLEAENTVKKSVERMSMQVEIVIFHPSLCLTATPFQARHLADVLNRLAAQSEANAREDAAPPTETKTKDVGRNLWQRAHHIIGHLTLGLSNGMIWAWVLHDWTWHKGWDPEYKETLPKRWKGLE